MVLRIFLSQILTYLQQSFFMRGRLVVFVFRAVLSVCICEDYFVMVSFKFVMVSLSTNISSLHIING